MMVRDDRLDVDPKVFTPGHVLLLRDAAQEPGVQRIFVNAAIKKALCREAKGDRGWLAKIRPWWGHDYHFHIRMRCPPGNDECEGQPSQSEDEGCKPADLAYWFSDFGPASKTAAHTSEAEATDDAGAVARRLQGGAACAGREAITSSSSRLVPWSRNELLSRCARNDRVRHTLRGLTMRLSARNQIKGTVVEVTKGATTSHVRVDIGGTVMMSSITNEAVDDLGIKAGGKVIVVVKASDVMIAVD